MPRLSAYPMQMLSSWMLPDTFLQERKVLTPDRGGGFTTDWGEINTALPGFLIAAPHPQETARGAKHVAGMTHMFYTYPGTDIQRGDRLSITKEGRTHIVTILDIDNPGMLNHHLEITCKEYEPGILGQGQDEVEFDG